MKKPLKSRFLLLAAGLAMALSGCANIGYYSMDSHSFSGYSDSHYSYPDDSSGNASRQPANPSLEEYSSNYDDSYPSGPNPSSTSNPGLPPDRPSEPDPSAPSLPAPDDSVPWPEIPSSEPSSSQPSSDPASSSSSAPSSSEPYNPPSSSQPSSSQPSSSEPSSQPSSSEPPHSSSLDPSSEPSVPPSSSDPSSSSAEPSSSSSSEEPEPVTPENVRYAVTDAPRNFQPKSLKGIASNDGKYASYAITLAKKEIASFGYQVFNAFAIVPEYVLENGAESTILHYMPGLGFTRGDVYSIDGEDVILSCGFMQLTEDDALERYRLMSQEEIDDLNETTAQAIAEYMQEHPDASESVIESLKPDFTPVNASGGVFVASADKTDMRRFVIEDNIWVEGFAGVYQHKYFSYKQCGDFRIDIEVKNATENIAEYADEDLDVYSYDEDEYLYKGSLFRDESSFDAFTIYNKRAKQGYEYALQIVEQILAFQDYYNGQDVKIGLNNIILFDEALLKAYESSQQRATINGILESTLAERTLRENDYLQIGAAYGEFEQIHVQINRDVNYANKSRMTSGFIRALTAAFIATAAVGCIVASGGAATPLLMVCMATAGGASLVYAGSEFDLAVKDVVKGYVGDETPSSNALTEWFCSDKVFGERGMSIYHLAGQIATIGCGFMGAVNTGVSQGLAAGNSALSASVIASGARAGIVQLGKVLITEKVVEYVCGLTDKLGDKMGLDESSKMILGYGAKFLTGLLTYTGLGKIDETLNLSGTHRILSIPEKEPVKIYDDMEKIEPGNNPYKNDNLKAYYDKVGDGSLDQPALIKEQNFYKRQATIEDVKTQIHYEQNLNFNKAAEIRIYGAQEYEIGPSMRFQKKNSNASASFADGYYDPETGVIYISAEAVERDSYDALHTLAHLMRHAYQLQNAEFGSPVEKALRVGEYLGGSENEFAYRNNPAEIDAEAYADWFVARIERAGWIRKVLLGEIELKTNAEKQRFDREYQSYLHPSGYPDPDTYKGAKS